MPKFFWGGGTAPSPDPTPTGEGETPPQTPLPSTVSIGVPSALDPADHISGYGPERSYTETAESKVKKNYTFACCKFIAVCVCQKL